MFHDFGRDLRFAVRSLTSAPGFAFGVIGSLILGIVANTTAFSFINAAVFRPFPGVRDQHELVQIGVSRPTPRGGIEIGSSYEEYQRLRAALPALNDLAAHHRVQLVVTHRRESSAVNGALVSTNWLDTLRVRPAAGRFFLPDETNPSEPVAVIGHDLRQQLFSDDEAAIGQTILVNGVPTEIIGVAPPRFYGTHKGSYRMDVWLPLALSHVALRDSAHRPVSM